MVKLDSNCTRAFKIIKVEEKTTNTNQHISSRKAQKSKTQKSPSRSFIKILNAFSSAFNF